MKDILRSCSQVSWTEDYAFRAAVDIKGPYPLGVNPPFREERGMGAEVSFDDRVVWGSQVTPFCRPRRVSWAETFFNHVQYFQARLV